MGVFDFLKSKVREEYVETEILETGTKVEKSYIKGQLSTIVKRYPDDSYELFGSDGVKISEKTSDGTHRVYEHGKLIKETTPDKTVTTYHENGNVSTITRANGEYVSYYDNQKLHVKRKCGYEIARFKDGSLKYEFKNGNLKVNPVFFSYYRIGAKDKNANNHWNEDLRLDPNKKTLFCLGGDQTKNAKEANGNINAFLKVLGLNEKQQEDVQLCSCYRPSSFDAGIHEFVRITRDSDKRIKQDYRREILAKFMPFMAQIKDGKFERYSSKKLNDNFRNIMIQAHCYGANDLPVISKVFKEAMASLGYSKNEIQKALKQVICITNNSQRELNDNTGFTCFHRYSVKDGQFEPEYDTRYSDDYPVFLGTHETYSQKSGNKSALVAIKPNEALMVFDKVLTSGSEHNEGFWTLDERMLTEVGKKQAELMKQIGRFWYENSSDVPDVDELLLKCSAKSGVRAYVIEALRDGKKLKAEQKNMLVNHYILKKEWNTFNSNKQPETTGIFKALAKIDNRSH